MDGIQTKVYCPVCRSVVEICLRKNLIGGVVEFFKHMQGVFSLMPEKPLPDKDVLYRGRKECSCGKVIEITFNIEAHTKRNIFQRNLEI